MAGQKREARFRARCPAIHVFLVAILPGRGCPAPVAEASTGHQSRARRSFSEGGKAGHDEGKCMPANASTWSLHSRLKEDTIDIGDLPLCRVLVIKDAHYPWLLLVPRRHEAVEIIDLDEVEQSQLMTEISRVARALKEVTRCDKLNIAALGNLVPQLHVHVIARRSSDAAWPRPVWGVMPPLAHDAEEVQTFISALRRKIWLG
jgi:diadenosine tetraphosphate (Ap4A) HIT family hydrolase